MSLTFGPAFLGVALTPQDSVVTVTKWDGTPVTLTQDVVIDNEGRVSFTVAESGVYTVTARRAVYNDFSTRKVTLSDGPDFDPSDIRSVVDYLLSRPSGGGPTDGVTQEELAEASTADRNRTNHTGLQAISTVIDLEPRLSSVESEVADAITQAEVEAISTEDRNRANHTGVQDISTVTGLETRLTDAESAAAAAIETAESAVTQPELATASTNDRNRENHTGLQAISTITDLETRLSGAETDATSALAAADAAVSQEELTIASTADRDRTNHTGSQPIGTVTNLESRLSGVETVASDAVTTAELDSASTTDRNRANHTGTQAISTIVNLETRLSDAESRVTQAELASNSTADRSRSNHTGTQAISTVTNLETRLSGAETDADTAVAAISRTSSRSVGQSEQAVNAKDHGAVGNGSTDDRASIQAALNAAVTAGSSKVLLTQGDYLISSSSLSIPAGVSLVGEGIGVSRLLRGGAVTTIIDLAGGSVGSTVTTLTANAAVGAATLTVASTAGISAGDWLMLLDDRAPDPDKPTRPGGEIIRIASVDSGTSLTLVTSSPTAVQSSYRGVGGTFDDTAQDGIGPYLTSSNARLAAVTLAEGSSVRLLSVVNLNPGTVSSGVGISAGATLNAQITDVEIYGIDGTAINLGHAIGAKITGCDIHDLVDDAANNRLGYGINIAGGASDILISDCTFARLRHGVTTDGHANGGIPRRISVSNCRAFQTHHSSFDTHGAGLDITFSNCVSVDSEEYGFSVRGRRVAFRNCEVVRPDSYGFNVSTVPARRIIIDSCTVRDGNSAALRVGGDGIVDVHISNFFVDGCAGNGVLLGYGNTRQVITNSRFFNIGQGGAGPYYGITFATGTLGAVNAPNTLISGNLFIKDKTYGGTTDYNAAVRIPHVSLTSVAVWGTRAYGIYAGGDGFILDSGTTTVLWDNIRPGGTHGGTSGTTATTTQLNSIASLINLTKRRGMTVFNITTGKPVWASADGAAATWVDGTGTVAHTPV